jgi:hypothetical protein
MIIEIQKLKTIEWSKIGEISMDVCVDIIVVVEHFY